jgi:outer membrane immunogenic protein
MMIPCSRTRCPLLGIISMRCPIFAAAFALATLPAVAADMAAPPPVLRGALPADTGVDWSGFYFGGFGGFNAQTFSTRNSASNLPAAGYATTRYGVYGNAHTARPVDRTSAQASGFGVFAGYNWGVDGYVLGVEADYTRSRLKGSSQGSLSGVFQDPTTVAGLNVNEYAFTSSVQSKMEVRDHGTIRVRVGMPFDNVMPYITGGLAWARTSWSNSASLTGNVRQVVQATGVPVTAYAADPTAPGPLASIGVQQQTIYGYAVGAGVEFALTSNILLRGEVMTSRFTGFSGGSNKNNAFATGLPDGVMSINTARAGAAVKF